MTVLRSRHIKVKIVNFVSKIFLVKFLSFFGLICKPFHSTGLALYLLKTSDNLWFSGVSRGCCNVTLGGNGLLLGSGKKVGFCHKL